MVYDDECPDWNYTSRTNPKSPHYIGLGQAPAVYGYSPAMNYKPNDYHVLETGMDNAYYALNNYDITGRKDWMGVDRCENFLFKDDTALYNDDAPNDRGFPRRELLTMSGNVLKEIAWEQDRNNNNYLKFATITPSTNVSQLNHKDNPDLVHIFNIVQFRDNQTITNPKINRNGYLYYYLISRDGYGYMPERFVKRLV